MLQQQLDPVGDADDVAAGLALNVYDHRRSGVHPGGLLHVFRAIDRGRDIGEPDRRSVLVSHDHVVVLRARAQLIIGADGEGLARAIQHALGLVDVGRRERGPNIFQTQSVGSQRGGIGLDPHCRFLSAADRYQTHAGKLRNFLGQRRVRQVLHLRQRQCVRSQRQCENRGIRRIHLAVDRRIGKVARQIRGAGIDCGLDLLLLDIDVLVEIELQRNDRTAQRTGGSHLAQSGDLAKLALQRRRHRRCHDVGVSSGIERHYLDGGIVNFRKRRDGKLGVGDHPHQQKPDHQ